LLSGSCGTAPPPCGPIGAEGALNPPRF
jgi:hypothetical protein